MVVDLYDEKQLKKMKRFAVKKSVDDVDERKRIRQVTITDGNGEVISDSISQVRSQNGSGFVISYTEKMCDFLSKVTSGSIVRLFVFIAHHQNYGNDNVWGYRTSRKYLSQVLNMNPKTVYEGLEYLIKNFLIVENKIDGSLEFMVNPDYVTMGTNKKARVKEWSQRWRWYFDNEARLQALKKKE